MQGKSQTQGKTDKGESIGLKAGYMLLIKQLLNYQFVSSIYFKSNLLSKMGSNSNPPSPKSEQFPLKSPLPISGRIWHFLFKWSWESYFTEGKDSYLENRNLYLSFNQ